MIKLEAQRTMIVEWGKDIRKGITMPRYAATAQKR
jgi:hypothetical protein